jgi:heam-based aerotactic trancducer
MESREYGDMVLGKSIFKSKKTFSNWLQLANNRSVVFSISDPKIQNQYNAIGLTLNDIKISKAIQPFITEHSQHFADECYSAMSNISEFNTIISKYSDPDSWTQKHAEFLVRAFDGSFDDTYIKYLYQLAKGHQAMGVLSQWYAASFQIFFQSIQKGLLYATSNQNEFFIISSSVSKVLNFHQQIILEALDEANIETKRKEF